MVINLFPVRADGSDLCLNLQNLFAPISIIYNK